MRVAPDPNAARLPPLHTLQYELEQREARVRALEQQLSEHQGAATPTYGDQPLPPISPSHVSHTPTTPAFVNYAPQHRVDMGTGSMPAAAVESSKSKEATSSGWMGDVRSLIKDAVIMLISVAIYLGLGMGVYSHLEGWSLNQCIYFCMVTMSTVGYGDLSPSSPGSKLFTIFMIFFGIIGIFSQVGAVLETVLVQPLTARARKLLNRLVPPKLIDIDGDGDADFSYPRHFVIFYSKGLVPSILLNATVQVISAAIFNYIEGWGYGNALYHCVVTATTVGYGDMPIRSDAGRVWASFHILLSVVLLAEAIATLGALHIERAEAFQRLAQLNKKLDHAMMASLLDAADELRADGVEAAVSASQNGLSELEFVVSMLLQLDICKMQHVRPFIKKFRALDADGSGRLGKDDLELAVRYSEEELLRMRQRNSQVHKQGALVRGQSSFVRPSAFEMAYMPN